MSGTYNYSDSSATLARQNRLHSMLSRTNRTIVRAQAPSEMYDAVCHIAIEQGGFGVARVVLLVPGTLASAMVVVSQAGVRVAEGLSLEKDVALPEEMQAAETGTPVLINIPAVTGKGGSLASMPIYQDGNIVGAFTVITDEPGFCSYPDVKLLLLEIAEDISFALGTMLREERRLATESKMRFLAHYDMQTGLPQRPLFEERLVMACENGHLVAVLAIRLCNYHGLLQVLGQGCGTGIARTIGERLAGLLPAATVARISESDFALILENVSDREDVAETAAAVHKVISAAILVNGDEVFVDPFIGVACAPEDGSPEEVLKAALMAAMVTSQESANGHRFYVPDMDRDSRRRIDLEGALRHALERDEFLLYYQPQIDLVSGNVVGAEALLRWNRPGIGLVSPAEFIPLLENSGLIAGVGEWVLNEACLAGQRLQDKGLPPLRMAVNLSARQFQDGDIRAIVRRALNFSKLEPRWLELELTESIVLVNTENIIRTLHDLKTDGVTHALDDFGTGYSSLSYLQRLPVSRLKIDRSFVSNITNNPNDAAITRAIVSMAHSLGLSVIAEGVETEGQLGYLRILRCEEMQGYYFSPPLPEQKLLDLLSTGAGIKPPEHTHAERTLLLVDAELSVLSALRRLLQGTQIRVLATSSVREAFNILAIEPVGVVVCDQRMPEMTGTEFLRRVKEIHPGIMRIVLSGYTDLNSVIDAVNHGSVYKFLTKPWRDELLLDALEDAFMRHEMERDNKVLSQRVDDMLSADVRASS